MSSRRPLQPIPALSANISSTRHARGTTTSKTADGTLDMAHHVQDDAQNSGSVVSGLSSLEGDDEFEQFMIEKARDERRLHAAPNGRLQPFRKARTQARVGLTMDNLKRVDAHNAHDAGGPGALGRSALHSPPSSSGSMRSSPAVHAPASWGRKGRTNADWMRNITRDEPPQQAQAQTPAPPERGSAPRRADDSPLSHKGFHAGPQRPDSSGELDLTFDMNEASMLVSTPYIPRNTKLDDIRAREMETLREQRLASARLERIREHSPEETRRPSSLAAAPDTGPAERPPPDEGSPGRRLRRRTNSWQSLSKSQPELGKENSPIAVYGKSIETVGLVERDVMASAERTPARPFASRRTDSQDLLRRLARVSNTPSPKASAPPRPHTDPAPPQHSASRTAGAHPAHPPPAEIDAAASDTSAPVAAAASTATQQAQSQRGLRHDTPHDATTPDVPSSAPPAQDIDATPMPTEPAVRNPKTPYVMGGWVDTPGPRTTHKSVEQPTDLRSQSVTKGSSSTSRAPEMPAALAEDEQSAARPTLEPTQHASPPPQLPSSALQALVQEARASHDYGEDTIHSLEELIAPTADDETEDDTLHGIELPTTTPRSEAERERQAEAVQLHRLRQRLRTTTTSLRDASRGMSRVGTTVEHNQPEGAGERGPIIVREVSAQFSPWEWFRSFFWDERLKTQRQVGNRPLKMWGGVTLLSILLTLSFIWWASETVACEIYCHPEYASYSPYPFAVNTNAPKRGVVIPTLIYRTFLKTWSTPITSSIAPLLSWTWSTCWSLGASITSLNRLSYGRFADNDPAMSVHTQASWGKQEKILDETLEEDTWDWSMAEDEILRR
ncbi:hypothetical protein C7974DRAFT_442352 [Boeremia exigua]|uniref:uncharacterized protein n=1 Tax=Boeremia exigua TaxID=749465 RepID=UPI001E8EAF4A|nr:uncharacterized protein C7974DRAFT_442352 [Boeremia exigua]KAH6616562.1 hypothetical protein C7974DRAFT_442352 [Boeremia exigua]